jgi:hypothetical protein
MEPVAVGMEERAQHATWVNPAKGRYYQVHLGRDLFGDWTLLKVWGGYGSRRDRLHSSGVASYADGLAQLRAIAKRRAAISRKTAPLPRPPSRIPAPSPNPPFLCVIMSFIKHR